MATPENNGRPSTVTTMVPVWMWGLVLILVVALSVRGVQLMGAQEKSDRIARSHQQTTAAAEAKAAKATQELDKAQALLAQAKSELDTTRAAKAAADSKVERFASEAAKLKSSLATVRNDLNTARAASRDTLSALSALSASADKLKAAVDSAASKLKKAQGKPDNPEKRAKQLEAQSVPAN